MPEEQKLEEQAISGAAAMTLSTQLDEVENLDVDIKTDLLKIVQGQAESISVVSQGVVMQKDIRVQEMELHTDKISINPLSALFGQIELKKPVDATARMVLSEQDLNRALNSEFIRDKFPNIQLNVEGQDVSLKPQKLEIFLATSNKMTIKGSVLLTESAISRSISFIAVICLPVSRPLLLEAFHCAEGDGITLEFAIALMQKAKELLHSPYIDLEGMALRVKSLEVEAGNLTLHTEAYVRQLPDFNNAT